MAPTSWYLYALSPEGLSAAQNSMAVFASAAYQLGAAAALANPWFAGPLIATLILMALRPPARFVLGVIAWRLELRARRRRKEALEARDRQEIAEDIAARAQVEAGEAWSAQDQAVDQSAPETGVITALKARQDLVDKSAASGSVPASPSAAPAERAAIETSHERVTSGADLARRWRTYARRSLLIVGLFSVFINLLMLTIPVYLFQVSDRVLSSRSVDTLVLLTIIAIGFIGVLALLDTFRRKVLSRLSVQFETRLGGPILAAVISGGHASDQSSVQPLRNLHQVRGFIGGPVPPLLFDGAMAPLYFAAVFLIHPDLGVIAVTAGALLVAVAVLNQWATSKGLGDASGHSARADANAEALARNAQVINAMGMLNESILQWGREQAKALIAQSDAQDRNFWITGASKFIRLSTQIAMLGWGGYLALNGQITGGTMIAASIIAGRALQPIEGMIEGWRSLVQARGAYKRIMMIVEALEQETQRLLLPRPTGRIDVEKLLYIPQGSKEPVLNGVEFTLKPGESLAILGPSGSGKTTLARLMVGCLRPTAGRVRLDGTDLRNWDPRQFGEFTGYLPQEVELFPGTIKDNISRMREDRTDESVVAAASLTAVHDLVTKLPNGYETVLSTSGAPLSGGQKQRIALARAFFENPAFVVLDEPNANLDATGEAALAEAMKNAKAAGVTIVAITQRPALLTSVDKVLVLRNGKQEAFGAPSEVMHRLVRPTEVGQGAAPRGKPLPAPAAGTGEATPAGAA